MVTGTLFFYVCLVIVVSYLVILLWWTLAWKLYPQQYGNHKFRTHPLVSVVVATRNEEKNLDRLLNCLHQQSYPHDKFEVIITDDFSEDNTIEIFNSVSGSFQGAGPVFKLVTASINQPPGKKSAINRAVQNAAGELILLTDADCVMGCNWVASFADCYQSDQASMITGFVRLDIQKGFLKKLQALEFLSLSGTGAVSVITGKLLMCNGANLAFTRQAFRETGGYEYGGNIVTGDDTFMMLQFRKNGKKIVFNKNTDSIVTSYPAGTFKDLLEQRKRWASKIPLYKEANIKLMGLFIFLVNVLMLIALFMAVINSISLISLIVLWLLKGTGDFIFIWTISGFARQRSLLLLFLPLLLLYPFYAVAGLIITPGKSNYTWKGRSFTGQKPE